MTLQQEQDLLARLYTDREFREHVLDVSGGDDARASKLALAAADEVRWFAETLVTKRLREVEKLLPLSLQEIGKKEFESRFRRFAETYSPTTVKKHLDDAMGFTAYLRKSRSLEPGESNIVTFEAARLRHKAFDRRFSLCFLKYDPRKVVGYRTYEPRSGVGIWIAIGECSRILFRPSRRRIQQDLG